jgi:uncharacterized protein YnzC (UPF0291/DUF896 family)
METKEEREKKRQAYLMAIRSTLRFSCIYGSMGGEEVDFQILYEEYIAKQKQESRDKKIEEILNDEYTTI